MQTFKRYFTSAFFLRRWKLKCAKQQREGDSLKHRLAQAMDRNQQLLTDSESHRAQNGASSHRVDSLQREFNDILVSRRFPAGWLSPVEGTDHTRPAVRLTRLV